MHLTGPQLDARLRKRSEPAGTFVYVAVGLSLAITGTWERARAV